MYSNSSEMNDFSHPGSLDKLLFDQDQPLSEEKMMKMIRRIAAGMLHLHKHNIVHRDLAARNVLLTESGEPKISVIFFFVFLFNLAESDYDCVY
jgi:serine/threonine protein kinase